MAVAESPVGIEGGVMSGDGGRAVTVKMKVMVLVNGEPVTVRV